MNRRTFIRTGTVAATTLAAHPLNLCAANVAKAPERPGTKIAAYYLRAQMYTCVPRQIREDMEWMAARGTSYVCVAFLEQDLFAAQENHALVAEEAARAGIRVLAVPSRWGGLTAGAPKVPSLFSVANPDTWMVNKRGTTFVSPQVSGVISSIHHPKTLTFFCESLEEMYRQHPAFAGFIIDEPKCFNIDASPMAVAALGANAPLIAHLNAARDFFSNVCHFAKKRWPDKLTLMFQKADNHSSEELASGGGVAPLDYFGCDGRPWTKEDDAKYAGSGSTQESGKGKVLLSGVGQKFIDEARRVAGRGAFFLAENHNLHASMIEPLDRNFAAALALRPEIFAYYYYPRNVQEPDRVMNIIGEHLKRFQMGA